METITLNLSDSDTIPFNGFIEGGGSSYTITGIDNANVLTLKTLDCESVRVISIQHNEVTERSIVTLDVSKEYLSKIISTGFESLND